MHKEERLKMLKTSWELHSQVETSYLNHQAKKGDEDWLEKQRMLLADMALHLLQTSIKPGEIELDKLRSRINFYLQLILKKQLKNCTKAANSGRLRGNEIHGLINHLTIQVVLYIILDSFF